MKTLAQIAAGLVCGVLFAGCQCCQQQQCCATVVGNPQPVGDCQEPFQGPPAAPPSSPEKKEEKKAENVDTNEIAPPAPAILPTVVE